VYLSLFFVKLANDRDANGVSRTLLGEEERKELFRREVDYPVDETKEAKRSKQENSLS
jgi:hypothetical protein